MSLIICVSRRVSSEKNGRHTGNVSKSLVLPKSSIEQTFHLLAPPTGISGRRFLIGQAVSLWSESKTAYGSKPQVILSIAATMFSNRDEFLFAQSSQKFTHEKNDWQEATAKGRLVFKSSSINLSKTLIFFLFFSFFWCCPKTHIIHTKQGATRKAINVVTCQQRNDCMKYLNS